MNYKEVHSMTNQFISKLDKYCINNNDVSESYYIAKCWIDDLLQKSYTDNLVCEHFYDWLKFGGTINLNLILSINTSFEFSNLKHFNAFCLLDTVNILKQ